MIAGQLYAGGTDRFLARRAATGWEPVGSEEMANHLEAGSAENLTGFGPDELYAVGWDGEIWTNQGGPWRLQETPADLLLSDADVSCERVYVGGQMGVILEGGGSEWAVVDNKELDCDIWSVRAFRGAVYFSTASGILRLKDGELTLAKPVGPGMRTAMSLFIGPSGLWSVGPSDIALFDGYEWRTVAQS